MALAFMTSVGPGVHRGNAQTGRARRSCDEMHLFFSTSFLPSRDRSFLQYHCAGTLSNMNRLKIITMHDSESDADSKDDGLASGNLHISAPIVILLLSATVLEIAPIGCVLELSGGTYLRPHRDKRDFQAERICVPVFLPRTDPKGAARCIKRRWLNRSFRSKANLGGEAHPLDLLERTENLRARSVGGSMFHVRRKPCMY